MRKITIEDTYALVDKDLYEYLSQFSWTLRRGYATAYIDGQNVDMHWLILERRGGFQIDHKNRNILDNRKHNLRYATYVENQMNTTSRLGTSDYKWVGYHQLNGYWRVRVRVPGEAYSKEISGFQCEHLAALAGNMRAIAVARHVGAREEFLLLNQVPRKYKKRFLARCNNTILERLETLGITCKIVNEVLDD